MKQKPEDANVFVPKKVKKAHMEQLAKYRRQLWKKPVLRTLFIEMTVNCNQHCRHCGSYCGDITMENQLSDKEILQVLATLKEQILSDPKSNKKLPFLNITGGEPLVRPGFTALMKQIHELGYRWGITSNGLLIDKAMACALKEAGMSTVSISLDGLKESHDWFRNSTGGYEKALTAVKNLMAENFKNVMITTVVHKRNIDELDAIYEVVKETGCDSWRIVNVEPIGRALTDDEIRLDTSDYKKIIDFIIEKRAADNSIDISYGCNHYLGYKRERETRPWYFICTAGIYTGGIFYNGDIGACLDIERHPDTIQGNVRTDDFYTVWKNKFKIFRQDKAKKSSKCKDCKHRRFCGGDGFHTWDVEKNEPRLCMYKEIKKANKEKSKAD